MNHEKTFLHLPYSIWILSFTGFLLNLATIMVFSPMPIFMTEELGATEQQVGVIDGFVELVSYAIRVVAGSVSDILQKRKLVLGIGYTLSALVKPLFALSSSIGMVVAIRSLDRITNGLQASPRDALIADISPPTRRGAAYGLSKSLKPLGSVIGAGLVIWIMSETENNFRLVFLIAFIPAFIAVVLFMIGVKEPHHKNKFEVNVSKTKKKFRWGAFRELKSGFWKIILLLAVFELAHFGESYLTFRAAQVGVEIKHISFVMLIFNLGQFLISYPIGSLSDRFQRRDILLLGFCFMVAANLFMMYGTTPLIIYIGVFCWGAQMGTTQSVFVSMVSDETPQYLRGTAFGIFYIVMGIDIMIASKIAGLLWENYSPMNAFFYSACVSIVSIFFLFLLVPKIKRRAS